VLDTAEGDAEQHEDDEELPKRAQGEVPFESRVCGRAGTLSRPHFPRQISGTIRMRLRPESSGIHPEYFLKTG
jgi:hypothetical protein